MTVITVDAQQPDPALIARAAAVIRGGGLVAFPTETVYGLGANALDAAAVARIFTAKGRPAFDPLIVHVLDAQGAERVVRTWPAAAARLANRFWPGPLTLVLPKRDEIPASVTAGLDTVGVRAPRHAVARALLAASGVPIAAPSANRFTELSPTRAEHVARTLGDRIDLILDGGPTTVGIESTVVDASSEPLVLLRPGMISSEAIAAATGVAVVSAPEQRGGARPAPGMVDRHYAPRARLQTFAAGDHTAERDARTRAADGQHVGALLVSESPFEAPVAHRVHMPDDPEHYAQRLYAALHELDDAGCDVVFVEDVPATPAWEGVRDRLRRASAR